MKTTTLQVIIKEADLKKLLYTTVYCYVPIIFDVLHTTTSISALNDWCGFGCAPIEHLKRFSKDTERK